VSEANIQPGDLVLYGTAPFHHVEMYVGPGSRTIGHGSPPVDAGVIHLLPGPVQIRRYV
jgi:cell wall-associated NlpC family hydrolase